MRTGAGSRAGEKERGEGGLCLPFEKAWQQAWEAGLVRREGFVH